MREEEGVRVRQVMSGNNWGWGGGVGWKRGMEGEGVVYKCLHYTNKGNTKTQDIDHIKGTRQEGK